VDTRTFCSENDLANKQISVYQRFYRAMFLPPQVARPFICLSDL